MNVTISNQVKTANVATKGLEVTAGNLSKKDIKGYAERSISVSSSSSNPMGKYTQDMGVEIVAIRSARDDFLDKAVVRQSIVTNYYQNQDYLGDLLEIQLGEGVDRISDPNTISSVNLDLGSNGFLNYLDDFFNGASELSFQTNVPTSRVNFIDKANALCSKFNKLDQTLEDTTQDIAKKKVIDIGLAKGILQDIAKINENIIKNPSDRVVLGVDLDFIDERQEKIEELSKYISFETNIEPNPNPKGKPIFTLFVRNQDGEPVNLIEGAKLINTIAQNPAGGFMSQSQTGVEEPIVLSGGSLQGYDSFLKNVVMPFKEDVDSIAKSLIRRVNEAYQGNFFDPSVDFASAKAIRLQPGLTAQTLQTGTPASPSGNFKLNRIIDSYKDDPEGDLRAIYLTSLQSLGGKLHAIDNSFNNENALSYNLEKRRDSIMGVSEDEQAARLSMYSKMYQAALSLIKLLDECLESLINLRR